MTIQWRPISAPPLEAALYDGTNGADIVAGLAGSTFTSDAGGVLDFVDHQPVPQQYTAPWMLFRNGDGTFGGANDPATMFNYHDLAQIVADWAPIPGFVQSSGSEPVPASLLGQTADYDVTMSPALPNASYVPVAVLHGAPGVLSGHGILSVTVIDADTVRVSVQSAVASLAGATVHVTAYAVA